MINFLKFPQISEKYSPNLFLNFLKNYPKTSCQFYPKLSKIYSILKSISSGIDVKVLPKNLTFISGRCYAIPCKANSKIPFQIQWFKNKTSFISSKNISLVFSSNLWSPFMNHFYYFWILLQTKRWECPQIFLVVIGRWGSIFLRSSTWEHITDQYYIYSRPWYVNPSFLKLAIQLSFLAFRHVRALFRELFCEIANQSLYSFHNITDFCHLWFCEKLDEKLALSSSLTFRKNTDHLARTEKCEMRKMIGEMVYEMPSIHFSFLSFCQHFFAFSSIWW